MKNIRIRILYLFLLLPLHLFGVQKTTVMEFLERRWSFNRFSAALNETGIDAQLRKQNLIGAKFTLFAPTDRAFDAFGRMGLLRSPDPRILTTSFDPTDPFPSKPTASPNPDRQAAYVKFMQYHIIKGKLSKNQINRRRRSIKTLAGNRLNPDDIGRILFSVRLYNGVIHVVDKVLVNPELKPFLKING